jgi:phospholipid transport system substrate-binding protein
MRIRLLHRLILFAGLVLALPASAAADAGQTVLDLGNRTLQLLANDGRLSQTAIEAKLRDLWRIGFDVPSLSRSVAGLYWRSASEQQRRDFVRAYEDYVVRIYGQRFEEYRGTSFTVLKSRSEGPDGAFIESQIARPAGPPARIDWRLKKDGDDWKIIDVSVAGISMVVTQRDEFGAVMQRHGGQLEGLTTILREKVKPGG